MHETKGERLEEFFLLTIGDDDLSFQPPFFFLKQGPAARIVAAAESAAAAAAERTAAAAVLGEALQASDASARELARLRAFVAAGLVNERGELLESPSAALPDDIWRGEIFPRLSARENVSAALVSHAWAEECRRGVKGRGDIVVDVVALGVMAAARAGEAATAAAAGPPRRGAEATAAPAAPAAATAEQQQQQKPLRLARHLLKQERAALHQQCEQLRTRPQNKDALQLSKMLDDIEKIDRLLRGTEAMAAAVPDLAERVRANAGSIRKLRLLAKFPSARHSDDHLFRPEIDAAAALVSELPLLTTVEITGPELRASHSAFVPGGDPLPRPRRRSRGRQGFLFFPVFGDAFEDGWWWWCCCWWWCCRPSGFRPCSAVAAAARRGDSARSSAPGGDLHGRPDFLGACSSILPPS